MAVKKTAITDSGEAERARVDHHLVGRAQVRRLAAARLALPLERLVQLAGREEARGGVLGARR